MHPKNTPDRNCTYDQQLIRMLLLTAELRECIKVISVPKPITKVTATDI